MVTYLMLLNWTDQGIKNVKDSPKSSHGRSLLDLALSPSSAYTAISN